MLSRLKTLAAACHGPVNAYAAIDLSGTALSTLLINQRIDAVRDLADRAGACGGVIKVTAFSSSDASAYLLGEASFDTKFGTTNARLIKARSSVDKLIKEVTSKVGPAKKALHQDGTDVLGQFTLAAQFQQQRLAGHLVFWVLSDGINTSPPVVMTGHAFNTTTAVSDADHAGLPDLAGAEVRVAGIGNTTGAPVSSERVTALTDFYKRACATTHATCLTTTDYTTRG